MKKIATLVIVVSLAVAAFATYPNSEATALNGAPSTVGHALCQATNAVTCNYFSKQYLGIFSSRITLVMRR